MRLHVMSDLHLEHHEDGGAAFIGALVPAAPVLVLAGDCFGLAQVDAASLLWHLTKKYEQIFYVPGNHEYYGGHVNNAEAVLSDLAETIPRLTVLRTGAVHEYGGRRFLGDTMWFPKPAYSPPGLNDFRLIGGFEPWVYERNAAFREWYRKEGKPGDIVITHHAPSRRSVHPRYHGSPANVYFMCDMEREISEAKPAMWIHGHMHNFSDYRQGETRVVCNPHGYPREAVLFDPAFVVTVDA